MPFATVCGGVRVTTWPPPVPGVSVSVVSDILGAEEKRRSRARKVGAQAGCGWWRAKLAFSQPMFIIRSQFEQIDTAENTKPGIPQCAL
jgi:hypothetical protein